MFKRLFAVYILFSLTVVYLTVWTASVSGQSIYSQSNYAKSGELKIEAINAAGNIYDCNMNILNNIDTQKYAVIYPTQATADMTGKYAVNYEEYCESILSGMPFCTELSYGCYFGEDVHVFNINTQLDENDFATHIIGYRSESGGLCGLEFAYNDILNNYSLENSVTYQTDGTGSVLRGRQERVVINESALGGIVTTIDKDIQQICIDAAKMYMEKGAIVVMDVNTGDIKAMASFPTYSYADIQNAMTDEDSPMINRALYAYSVGSIFKLVAAAAAIDSGLEDFQYECTGSTLVGSKAFNCHNSNGHGIQTMTDAVVNSCNPYFIELTRSIEPETLRSYAINFGFFDKIDLAKSISSMAGTLPTAEDLYVPAEKANFSFGQGYLTATPLQICRMTCGIAAYGEMPEPRLVIGTTDDGINIEVTNRIVRSYCVSVSTARKLRDFMSAVITQTPNSPAKAFNTTCAVKTSTAQTGRYDENGDEYCHAWITGFFPVNKPEYAVTVLAEDGGYGNISAAPVFKYIAEEITGLEQKRANE